MTNAQPLAELAELLFEGLSDEELEALSEYFDSLHQEIDSMNLSMIDGFLTALALSSGELPENWLALIVVDMDTFSKVRDHAVAVEWLMRHYQSLKYNLTALSEPIFEPIFLQHPDYEDSWVANWCYGFMQGVQTNMTIWEPFESIHAELEILTALSTLPPPDADFMKAEEIQDDDDRLFYEAQQIAVSALEEYHRVVDPLAGWDAFVELLVLSIHDVLFNPDSEVRESSLIPEISPADNEMTILCPCGSGKLFTGCCGSGNRLIH